MNAYVEPLVSMDLHLVIAVEDLDRIRPLLEQRFRTVVFPHGINLSAEGSALRARIRTDPRYRAFVGRAKPRKVLGVTLSVAGLDDVLQGKVWAVTDATRRPTKRQKDLADIARILEARPDLRERVPGEVLARLMA